MVNRGLLQKLQKIVCTKLHWSRPYGSCCCANGFEQWDVSILRLALVRGRWVNTGDVWVTVYHTKSHTIQSTKEKGRPLADPLPSKMLSSPRLLLHQPPLARLGWWVSLALVEQRYWDMANLKTLLILISSARHFSSKASAWPWVNLKLMFLVLLVGLGIDGLDW